MTVHIHPTKTKRCIFFVQRNSVCARQWTAGGRVKVVDFYGLISDLVPVHLYSAASFFHMKNWPDWLILGI